MKRVDGGGPLPFSNTSQLKNNNISKVSDSNCLYTNLCLLEFSVIT